MDSKNIRRLVECAILVAVGTVLSLFEFKGAWALGGGITFCSMLPLVMIAHRHGTKWGRGLRAAVQPDPAAAGHEQRSVCA